MSDYVKPLTEFTTTDFQSLFVNDEWEPYQCTCFIREDIDWENISAEDSKEWRSEFVKICSDGYIYYHNDQPVGWCQCIDPTCSNVLTSMIKPEESDNVKIISCYFIKQGFRQRGLIKSILPLVIEECQSKGIKTLYAIPTLDQKLNDPKVIPHTGFKSIYNEYDFSVIGKTEMSYIMKKSL